MTEDESVAESPIELLGRLIEESGRWTEELVLFARQVMVMFAIVIYLAVMSFWQVFYDPVMTFVSGEGDLPVLFSWEPRPCGRGSTHAFWRPSRDRPTAGKSKPEPAKEIKCFRVTSYPWHVGRLTKAMAQAFLLLRVRRETASTDTTTTRESKPISMNGAAASMPSGRTPRRGLARGTRNGR